MSHALVRHPVSYQDVVHVVHHLRERDRREIFALRWNDDVDSFIADVVSVAGALWSAWRLDGEPIALNGVVPVRPGVCLAGAFGTDKWAHAVRAITRHAREVTIPLLHHAGYHRGEAYALAANVEGRSWIELLGGEREAYLEAFGRNKEDFILYRWRLDDVFFFPRVKRNAVPVLHQQ
jgi:hypothetical protein